MGRLLDELLELSRVGRKEQLKSEVLLETVAQAAIDLVAGRIRERKVKVLITAPPILLHGYPQRFIQLYQNLLDNAVKFMGDQPDPLVEIGAFIETNGEVVLFVRDNGSGIDPQYQSKLFGLFEKLDPESEGTGIGLALVKRIVEVHEGRIWFTSKGIDKGTTFYFTLGKTKMLNQ
jgi:signal transduction histidine kinase